MFINPLEGIAHCFVPADESKTGISMGRKGFTPLEKTVRGKSSLTGFTFIEIMITLAVIGIFFVPMTQLFSHGLYSAVVSGDMITAVNLCRWEMERIKNAGFTKSQIKNEGNIWIPRLDEPPLKMNNAEWRIFRSIKHDSGPAEVTVEVFLAGNLNKPVASVATLIEDDVWIELK
ncbi:MAG: prepilin-type N-terminal cleavage/methylation domain-containing protein [Candidatus Omnitrophica bacterium]|nr:prepilin-type N-terminal cleavage/methylation domain-containing protein [Candidatus Omnitrophota bacterium]